MCCFVNYILPAGADEGRVRAVFQQMPGVDVQRVEDVREELARGVADVVTPGEEVWARDGWCDCDLPIGGGVGEGPTAEERREGELKKAEARYRRKGWSAVKIERAMKDMRRRVLPERVTNAETLEGVVARLVAEGVVPYVRVVWHFYSGAIRDERFAVADGGVVRCDDLKDRLWNLPQDVVLTVKSARV